VAERIEVVRGEPDRAGPGKPYGGQPVFDAPGIHVGLTRLGPGARTPWHHHGSREFVGYVISGSVTFEFDSDGVKREEASEGQFFRIPPMVVHRDVNESDGTTLIAVVSAGGGPLSVEAPAPPT